ARNAESLYWIGRYVERADDTSRILNVSVHQLLEDATVDPDHASRQLLAVLGIDPEGAASLDAWKLTELVAYARDNNASLVGSIERADMVVRLLLSRVADRASSPGWITVLRSAGAQDTYLRTYRGALDAGRVVQFLLRDTLFPRSVFHALRQAEDCLQRLDPG